MELGSTEGVAPAEIRRIGRLLESKPYKFAKTMPKMPHWYNNRDIQWAGERETYEEVIDFIHTYGTHEKFGWNNFPYLYINWHKYWTTGSPEQGQFLINRTYRTYNGLQAHPADRLVGQYATAFDDPVLPVVRDLLGDMSAKTLLDVYGGTGWFANHVEPLGYRLLEPSSVLMRIFHEINGGIDSRKGLMAPIDQFVGPEYDVAVCLGGRANSIPDVWLKDIPNLVKPGGRWLIAFDDAYPVDMGGEVVEAGEWTLLVGTRQE